MVNAPTGNRTRDSAATGPCYSHLTTEAGKAPTVPSEADIGFAMQSCALTSGPSTSLLRGRHHLEL